MTLDEISQSIIDNIETAREVMENGKTGFVLMSDDRRLLCETTNRLHYLDRPTSKFVVVLPSLPQATSLMRHWLIDHPKIRVNIILRREALQAYIDQQEQTLAIFTTSVLMANSGEFNMKDYTEALRREMIANGQPQEDLDQADRRWSTEELQRDFTVRSFLAPFVFVTRKADRKSGTMEFTHSPRFYFNFREDK